MTVDVDVDLGQSLGKRARSVWAKSHRDRAKGPDLLGWLPLYQHLDDAAGIAARLWDEWAPRSITRMLSGAFGGEDAARSLLVWLAGTHDVGKASPAFAMQEPELAQGMVKFGLSVHRRLSESDDRRRARHELVSFLAIREWLQRSHAFSDSQAEQLASVAAAHHGRPAAHPEISLAREMPHAVGDAHWAETREEILDATVRAFVADGMISRWRDAKITQPALAVLSGLVIVADWIASSDLFPSAPLGADPGRTTSERVASAWAALRFPRPWASSLETTDPAELLLRRFDLPADARPHPAQAAVIEQALRMSGPELMILEAEMGSGKTEAALLAAEILASRFQLGGIFIGLPTQATADGMFSRMLSWAERLDLETPANVFLARGRAEMNPEYARKTREAYFRSIDEESGKAGTGDEMLIAHRWFSNPRRGPLSDFVVGTVDQALFAGLRSRYVMLRHLALAGKVIVIDEVHAYDEYMGQFLARALEWLGAYGVPVILLSATLPSGRRREYLEAYDRGRDALSPAPAAPRLSWAEKRALAEKGLPLAADKYQEIARQLPYPSIVASSADGHPTAVFPPTSRESRVVQLDLLTDDPAVVVGMLRTALRDGGNVAIIRNTVRRAQETAALLRAELPDVEVTLTHSRFLGVDRALKDQALLDTYGRAGERPQKSIVVATQVIEQSLDVDFDLLVSDLAPIDLLLQRSGRMHRHDRPERPRPLREPRLVLTGASWDAGAPDFDGGSERVYGRAVLLRTAAVLHGRGSLSIPDDIAPLVELVYGDRTDFIPDGWLSSLADAERVRIAASTERIRNARAFTMGPVNADDPSLIGWVHGADVDPELTPPGRGTVRDGEATLEVIVLQRDDDGVLRTPAWLERDGGVQIPEAEVPSPRLTRTILGCFLRLPAGMCRGNALDWHIDTLERSFDLPYWHGSHALKGELVLVLDARGRAALNEFDLSYSPEDGLDYVRRASM
ncbi:CRISPR-associated helicase Cas3' [Microbacterium tumbae]